VIDMDMPADFTLKTTLPPLSVDGLEVGKIARGHVKTSF
jgi:hypothetical protein